MRRSILGALLSFGAGLLAVSVGPGGCAYDWALPNDGVSPDGGREGAVTDGPVTDSPIGDELPTPPPPPPPAACRSSAECPTERYCRFPDRKCGTGQMGTCEIVTKVGCAGPDGVCGCGGLAYKTECDATTARVDVTDAVGCATPNMMFPCGYRYCAELKQFCITRSGTIGDFDCESFDASCSPLDCTCVTVTKLACPTCDDTKAGQVKVKCP